MLLTSQELVKLLDKRKHPTVVWSTKIEVNALSVHQATGLGVLDPGRLRVLSALPRSSFFVWRAQREAKRHLREVQWGPSDLWVSM